MSLRPWQILAIIVALAITLRLILVLTHINYLGIDGGAYLLSVQQVLGQSPIGQDFTRPPLGPGWLLVPFTSVWGYDIGFKVWSAVFSVATVPAVYLMLRKLFTTPVALGGAAMAAVNPLHAELLVTGALPIIGFGLIGVAMWALMDIADGGGRRAKIILTVAVLATVAVNMTSAGLAMVVLPIFTFALVIFKRVDFTERMQLLKSIAFGGLAIAAMSMVFLPYYLDVLPGVGNLNHPGSKLFFAPWGNWGWFLMIASVSSGLFVMLKGSDYRVRAYGPVLVVLGLLAVIWSRDEAIINVTFRGRYLAAFLAYPVSIEILRQFFTWVGMPRNRLLAATISIAAAGLAVFGFIDAFHRQAYYSDQLTVETTILLNAIHDIDSDSPIIVNTVSMSWWVQAIYGVKAPSPWNNDPPPRWTVEHEQVVCILNWSPGCDVEGSISAIGARWLVIDTSFPARNQTTFASAPSDLWEATSRAPWLDFVTSLGDTDVYSIPPAPMMFTRSHD